MEEILASIRRIIADDDATKSAARPAEPAKPEPQPSQPVPVISAPPPPQPQAPPPRPRVEVEKRSVVELPNSFDSAVDQSSDILDLTESMASPTAAANVSAEAHAPPQFRTIVGTSDIGFADAAERAAPPAQPPGGDRGGLISSATSAAVDSAFNALAQTVLVQNARTLEDLVREMLRPMLKSWLDDNLPGMVERMVRAEIERVSRGRAS